MSRNIKNKYLIFMLFFLSIYLFLNLKIAPVLGVFCTGNWGCNYFFINQLFDKDRKPICLIEYAALVAC